MDMGDGISVETYTNALAGLNAAHSLRCRFPLGIKVDPTDPSLVKQETPAEELTFDSIDRERGNARSISQTSADDATVFSGPTALTFLQLAATGNPSITTVFPRFVAGTRAFYAAGSDHILIFNKILVFQYYGSCTILN
jgi:hypothetical protein